jgi:GNAT superfamily N-acetyltransferase
MRTHPAAFPADLDLVRSLFEEYASSLGLDLRFQNFDQELADLPGRYAPPRGGIWLAVADQVAGCVALRPLFTSTCELKRLYVRPAYRGQGIGRLLVQRALDAATDAGYKRICLDTLPQMKQAIELYESLGFEDVQAYCHSPFEGAKFFARELR